MADASSVTHVDLRVENGTYGNVVTTATPRLSWATTSAISNWRQGAAEVEVSRAGEVAFATVAGSKATLTAWPFQPLAPRESATLRVRVTGVGEVPSGWSPPVEIFAGHLGEDEWLGEWIRHPAPRAAACPVRFHHDLTVDKAVTRAFLYASARGVYQFKINGVEVDDEVLKPGWTSYGRRDTFATTDVTMLLNRGLNSFEADVAAGWYGELYGFNGTERRVYGDQPLLSAHIRIEYADGTSTELGSDSSWMVSDDFEVRSAGIYAGEHRDLRVAAAGFTQALSVGRATVVPRTSPPVRRMAELPVVDVIMSPSGATLLDFGQNLVGWLKLRVAGPAGTSITLRHAEVLEHGELGVRPLRRAAATDSVILAGNGIEEFSSAFTFHGFRYAEVSGWPGDFDPSAITAVVVHSDMRRTGTFECSDPLVTRLHENVVWGMRGNFLSIPTDCPQRDERLGWTGDAQVFSPTASFLFDTDAFLSSWLVDLALEQHSSGSVPFVVPDVLDSAAIATAAWGDAATVVPWTLYERLGDVAVLDAQYSSMKAWADHLLKRAGDRRLWENDFQFGDWLDPDAPPEHPEDAKVDPDIVATAYVFRSASIVSQAAAVLGRDADSQHYAHEAEAVRSAWLNEYVTTAGRIVSDAPTAYALAICFGLVTDDALMQALGTRLADLVRSKGYRISTGFVGTPLIQDALCTTGHVDAAARLLLQTENPSWLYPVTMGATTVWERWDSMLEDGSINSGEMTSFNHYALGAVADWLHRSVGGLAPDAPGYARARIAPTPLPGVDSARTTFASPLGEYSVDWRTEDGVLHVRASVPANATALVDLPGVAAAFSVGSGEHEWSVPYAPTSRVLAPASIDTPLSELVDDTAAFAALRDACDAFEPGLAHEVTHRLKWVQGATLRGSSLFFPTGLIDAIGAALGEMNRATGRVPVSSH